MDSFASRKHALVIKLDILKDMIKYFTRFHAFTYHFYDVHVICCIPVPLLLPARRQGCIVTYKAKVSSISRALCFFLPCRMHLD